MLFSEKQLLAKASNDYTNESLKNGSEHKWTVIFANTAENKPDMLIVAASNIKEAVDKAVSVIAKNYSKYSSATDAQYSISHIFPNNSKLSDIQKLMDNYLTLYDIKEV